MAEDSRVWGIHTQDDNLSLQKNVIAIGWRGMGDLSDLAPNREAFRERYIRAYPDAKKGNVGNGVGMLFRFVHEIQAGDYVVFPSKTDRMINIGMVDGPYFCDLEEGEYIQKRPVKWLKQAKSQTVR